MARRSPTFSSEPSTTNNVIIKSALSWPNVAILTKTIYSSNIIIVKNEIPSVYPGKHGNKMLPDAFFLPSLSQMDTAVHFPDISRINHSVIYCTIPAPPHPLQSGI